MRLRSRQWHFAAAFLREHRRLVALLLLSLAGAIAAEISIPLAAYLWQSSIIRSFESRAFFFGLPVALLGFGAYIAFVGADMYAEQRLLRSLSNSLRRLHIDQALSRQYLEAAEGVGRLVAKVTYHLSLLEVGIQQSFFGACRWLLMTVGLIGFSVFIDPVLLLFCLACVPLDIAVMTLTHLVAKRYVSREQTLSSRIIKETVALGANHQLLRGLRIKQEPLDELQRLMELDAFFRIRRAMWVKGSQAVLFVFLTFVAIVWIALEVTYGISLRPEASGLVVFGAVSALLAQKLFLSARIGLFLFPLHLGAAISLPPVPTRQIAKRTVGPLRTFSLRCRKTRLERQGPVHRKIQFDLRAGQSLEIAGTSGSGRSALAAVFAGIAPVSASRRWTLRLNGAFFSYADWQASADAWLVDPLFQAQVTLMEWFTSAFGRRLPTVGSAENILQKLSRHPELSFILQSRSGLSARWSDPSFSVVQRGLLQLARCLLSSPSLLVIDHVWFDIGDDRFLSLLRKIRQTSPDMMVVCFTKGGDSTLVYDQRISL